MTIRETMFDVVHFCLQCHGLRLLTYAKQTDRLFSVEIFPLYMHVVLLLLYRCDMDREISSIL